MTSIMKSVMPNMGVFADMLSEVDDTYKILVRKIRITGRQRRSELVL
jgi:hypothetical protein